MTNSKLPPNPMARRLIGFFFALCLTLSLPACSHTPKHPDMAPHNPHPQPALTLDSFHGYQGVWLRNAHAECFLASSPNLRILAFHRIGSQPLLRLGDNPFVGLRTAFMQPVADDLSYSLCNQPAQLHAINNLSATASSSSQSLNLQLSVTVRLDPHAPTLHITHSLTNTANHPRTLALWSIAALPRDGIAIAPSTAGKPPFRSFTYPAWSNADQPSVSFGSRAITVNFAGPLNGNLMKIGLRNDSGYAALLRGRDLLLSHVPTHPHATYPEGGPNITLFQMQNDQPWAEIEHVGPLTTLAPNQSLTMHQTLTLSHLPSPPTNLHPDSLLDSLIPR